MKSLVLSMLAIASMAAMSSCSNENDPVDEVINAGNQEKVEIKLSAGIVTATKSAGVIKETEGALANDLKVRFFRPVDAESPTWTTGDELYAVIAAASGHSISFKESEADDATDKKIYYSNTENMKSYLAGCYLDDAVIKADDDLKDGKIAFTITGKQDIMATIGKTGSKSSIFENFKFEHLLSQINVNLIGTTNSGSNFGKITKVEITEVPTQLELTLSGSDPAITPTATGNIEIYNGEMDIPTTSTSVGEAVMIWSKTSENNVIGGEKDHPLKVKITTSTGEYIVPIIITGGLQASQNHSITLTFSEKISASASFGEWTNNTNIGTGDIQ